MGRKNRGLSLRVRPEPLPVKTLFEELQENQKKEGKVKYYNDTRGYGFINHNGLDVFFHINDVEGNNIESGQLVKFGIKNKPDGRASAVKVEPAAQEGRAEELQLVNSGGHGNLHQLQHTNQW